MGAGIALSGSIRDVINATFGTIEGPVGVAGTANGYMAVYLLEIVLLLVTIAAVLPLIRSARRRESENAKLSAAGATPAPAPIDARGNAAR